MTTRNQAVVSCGIILTGATWAFAILRSCWLAGDHMFGLEPHVLLAFPVAAFCLVVGIVLLVMQKSKWIAVSFVVAAALITASFLTTPQVSKMAWRSSIQKFSKTNQLAIENTDFSNAVFKTAAYPDEKMMAVVEGFRWHCEQHIAAPQGVFRGFVCNSVPHVYVDKIRHGMRGLAWIDDFEAFKPAYDYEYESTGVDHWYTWTYGG